MSDLAAVIYAEARGESDLGKRGVCHVVLNRVNKERWPDTVARVVRQAGQFVLKFGSGSVWNQCVRVAENPGADPTGGATYFATYKAWPRKKFHGKIGAHYFYS